MRGVVRAFFRGGAQGVRLGISNGLPVRFVRRVTRGSGSDRDTGMGHVRGCGGSERCSVGRRCVRSQPGGVRHKKRTVSGLKVSDHGGDPVRVAQRTCCWAGDTSAFTCVTSSVPWSSSPRRYVCRMWIWEKRAGARGTGKGNGIGNEGERDRKRGGKGRGRGIWDGKERRDGEEGKGDGHGRRGRDERKGTGKGEGTGRREGEGEGRRGKGQRRRVSSEVGDRPRARVGLAENVGEGRGRSCTLPVV